jgi:hypothetical protein
MKLVIEVPDRVAGEGVPIDWEHGFSIAVESSAECVIRANKAGLLSLARILLTLASDDAKPGDHVHLDDANSLEDGSIELVIERL